MTWIFDPLPPLKYDLIMADPPWSFKTYSDKGKGKSPDAHYSCMALDDIKALPVSQLASRDCILWLWAINPMLDHCIDTLKAWGFTYVTAGSWEKITKHGKQAFGTGYCLRSSNEPVLIGKIGNPRYANNIRSSFHAQIREHSRKPDEAYKQAEALAIGAVHKADLFSRQNRTGWDSWGNEIGKFGEAA
jgi:Transcriptional activator, adenine-specific DNA methyltransferase